MYFLSVCYVFRCFFSLLSLLSVEFAALLNIWLQVMSPVQVGYTYSTTQALWLYLCSREESIILFAKEAVGGIKIPLQDNAKMEHS